MKTARISKKLRLKKETLRKLTPKELENVVGGDAPAIDPDEAGTSDGPASCMG
jgi:hypothetical protein